MENTVQYDAKGWAPKVTEKLRRLCWVIVNNTVFRWSPFFCYGWRRFLLRAFGAQIDGTATIGRRAIINAPWNLVMCAKSMICSDAWVMCYAKVEIGEQSMVGEYAKLLTGSHDINSRSFRGLMSPILIGKNCWIASNAMVVSGGRRRLKIGDGAVVGAGAVVMTSVPSMAVMLGNPAEVFSTREFCDD